jgi:hypothetical protein
LGHAETVRATCIIAFLAVVLVASASAASVDTKRLVFPASSVPAGFRVDPGQTGLRSTERYARVYPQARPYFSRWKRVVGHQARFLRGASTLETRSDVFRTAPGARQMLAWVDLETQKAGFSGQRRAPLSIGRGGWIHWVGDTHTVVIWRQGHVFAGVLAAGISRSRTIGLARAQERRIGAELDRVGP